MQLGDFTALAESYAKFRPGYSHFVSDAFLGLCKKPITEIDFADVGAGTGIWTRAVASKGISSAIAIEPNDEMRAQGSASESASDIVWKKGHAEDTGLESESVDLLTMASSFHWTDFDQATKEFCRVLKPEGIFGCLWNTRRIAGNSMLEEIEAKLKELSPNMKRISSGRSDFCDSLSKRLRECGKFKDVLQLQGYHEEVMTPDRYLGIWESVNDVRVQLGVAKFEAFLTFIKGRLSGLNQFSVGYDTVAWVAQKA